MTQNFVAIRGNAPANATDNGDGTFTLTITNIIDDSGVYSGIHIATGQKLVVNGGGGGTEMKIYDVVSVATQFVSQATFTVNDIDGVGTPGFGNMAVVEANSQGVLPVVSGIDSGLQQAITQYNQQIFEGIGGGGSNIYGADGQLAGPRDVDMNGNALSFSNGVQAITFDDGSVTTTANVEVTGSGNGIVRTASDGSRWLDLKNSIGATTSTKLT